MIRPEVILVLHGMFTINSLIIIIERNNIMKLRMKKLCILTLLIAASLFMFDCSTDKNLVQDPIIQTQYGLVRGIVNSDSTVIAFKGIPYAAPPIGDLRWREPQPPASWEHSKSLSRLRWPSTALPRRWRLPTRWSCTC